MAGDWIKFEKSTLDKPEVFEISEWLQIDPDAVIGKLLRVWSWFDEHSQDGSCKASTKGLLNRLVGCPGFCDAMQEVGWLFESDGVVKIPNFSRHIGNSAKSRASAAQRQAESRVARHIEAVSQNVTAESQSGNRKKSVIPRTLRADVYKRDGYACRYCGWHKDDPAPCVGPNVGLMKLSLDHVTPESLGGKTDFENLVTACLACNMRKSGRTPEEAEMSLIPCDKTVTNALPEKRREEKSIDKSTPLPPKGGWQADEIQTQINSLFRRKASTPWSEKELRAYRKISFDPEDLKIITAYYLASIPRAEDIRRRDIVTLLNNWPGEVDRARAFIEPTQKEKDYANSW